MWRLVDLVWTDVSEERIASIFRVEKSASEEPAWAGGCSHTRSTRRQIPEDSILHSHRREHLKSYIINAWLKFSICAQIYLWCVSELFFFFLYITLKYQGKLFIIFSSSTEYSMSSAAVLKGRPIELPPQISIWEYIENKVKNYGSKVAQVNFITCHDLHRFTNYTQRAARKNNAT
jgi:hypothetical protein